MQREITVYPTLGLTVPRDLPASRLGEFARAAEQAGVSHLWVVEDLGFNGGVAQAAHALAATRRLSVGIGLLPAGSRNVAFTAMEIATLAAGFPGRLGAVAVGYGMAEWMRQVGQPWPGRPVRLMREYVIALRALLAGREVTALGEHVQLDHVRLRVDTDPVPVLVGAHGHVSLTAARTFADGVLLAEPTSPTYVRRVLAAGTRQADDLPGGFVVAAYNLAALNPSVESYRMLRHAIAVVKDQAWAAHLEGLSFERELRQLRDQTRSHHEFAERLPDSWVREMSLVGRPREVAEQLRALATAGCMHASLSLVGADPLEQIDHVAELMAAVRAAD